MGEQFLIYDSFEVEDYENEDKITVFSTRENTERVLTGSRTWFVDGTFKVVPTVFCTISYLFVIWDQ